MAYAKLLKELGYDAKAVILGDINKETAYVLNESGAEKPEIIYDVSGENVFLEELQQNDKYILSEPDLYCKEGSFNSDETNICFVLGHSGSGKSVMSRTLEGDDIDHIELDDLLLTKDHFTMDELKNYSDMIYSYFNGEGSKYYIGIEERNSIPKEEYEDKIFIDFVKYAMDYAKKHNNYLIEKSQYLIFIFVWRELAKKLWNISLNNKTQQQYYRHYYN